MTKEIEVEYSAPASSWALPASKAGFAQFAEFIATIEMIETAALFCSAMASATMMGMAAADVADEFMPGRGWPSVDLDAYTLAYHVYGTLTDLSDLGAVRTMRQAIVKRNALRWARACSVLRNGELP